PVRLPGREGRFCEPPLSDVAAIVDDVVGSLARSADVPFAFFGHSMGALIAFETARTLRRRGRPLPRALVVSAFPAPGVEQSGPLPRAAPAPELVRELQDLGGTPEDALDPELLEIVLPIFRADLTAVETWSHVAEPPFSFPIHALGGTSDD